MVGTRGDTFLARVAGAPSHYIEFGVVLALVLPVALHYAFFAPPGRVRTWRWVQAGTVAFAIPLSISRSATLTVAVTFVMLATVWPWRHRYNAVVVSVFALAVFRVINPGCSARSVPSSPTRTTTRACRTGSRARSWSWTSGPCDRGSAGGPGW